jgi:hypothetical protein
MFTLQGTRASSFDTNEYQEPSHSAPTLTLVPPLPAAAPALNDAPMLRLVPGAVIEISGADARRYTAELLERYQFCPAAWIEKKLEPFPDEVRRYNLYWDRVLFVDGAEDSAWALSMFINSGDFPFVVYYAPYGCEKELRRIRRQAKASGTMVILLREDAYPAFPLQVQYTTQAGALKIYRGRPQ